MKSLFFPPQSPAQGVALITVLIVVAMVSATASWLMKSQFVSIQRAARVISQEQAMVHAFGIEPLVLQLLFIKDAGGKGPDYYTDWHRLHETPEGIIRVPEWNQERWSKPWEFSARDFVEFDDIDALENISWKVCVQDLNALIDINALYRAFDEPTGIWSKEDFMKSVLLNLFRQSYLGEPDDPDTPTPEKLYDSLKDWLDRDGKAGEDGAENSDYELKNPPYQTAAMRMAWPEEIHLIDGFREEVSADFMDVLTALPYTLVDPESGGDIKPYHKINLNTAPREVLQSLPGLGTETGQEVIAMLTEYRQDGDTAPIESFKELSERVFGILCPEGEDESKDIDRDDPQWRVCNFWNPNPAGRKKIFSEFLGFQSDFFLASVEVKTGDFSNDMQFLVYRRHEEGDSFKPYIVQRRFGKGYYNACRTAKAQSEAIKGKPR